MLRTEGDKEDLEQKSDKIYFLRVSLDALFRIDARQGRLEAGDQLRG